MQEPCASTGPLRVASVPAEHPYVRHVRPLLGDDPRGLVHLADPVVPGRTPGQWWPPVVLDPDWLRAHHGEIDLVHVHFGIESLPPGRLEQALTELERLRLPLVYTVHDLSNPQLHEQEGHRRDLDLLVEAADQLITLTPGAAASIAGQWGRSATVIRHPHVVPLDAAFPDAGPDPSAPLTIGLHLRDLRPNIDGAGSVRLLLDAVAELSARGTAAHVRVSLHERVRDQAQAQLVLDLVEGCPEASVVRHGRLGDAELDASLAGLDACLLPYRSGTHSGWLELCWDLGVPVLSARGVGFFGEQHDGLLEFAAGDVAALAGRLLTLDISARDHRRSLQQDRRAARVEQRRVVAEAHRAVYDAAVG